MAAAIGAWSVKGVDEEAKMLAKRAASEAGVTMGSWLEAAIFHISRQSAPAISLTVVPQTGGASTADQTSPTATPASDNSARLFNTTIRFGNPEGLAPAAALPALAPSLQPWQDNIETNQQQLQEQMVWLEQKLADLADGLQQMRHGVPPVAGTAPFADPMGSPAFTVQQISAKYELQSAYANDDRWANLFDNVLRLALIAALCAAAFLIGQRMGIDLSAF